MKSGSILLRNAAFVIQDADTVLDRMDVLVEAGQITQITETMSSHPIDASGVEIIDCRGILLMPGLVNAHTHLFQILTRGIGKNLTVRDWARNVTYPVAQKLSEHDYYFAALLACADAIRNGCTALVDHPTHFARFHSDESFRALKASGLRGAVVRGGSDFSLVNPAEVRNLTEDLEATTSFVRRWAGDDLIQPWVGPSGFHSCTPVGLSAFKELARSLGTRFHFHLAESQTGRHEAVQAGYVGEVDWAHHLGLLDANTSVAHAIWVSEEEIELLSQSRCHVVHCATSNQILASGVAAFAKMMSRGLPLALATDGASSNDSLDMVAEMKAAALLARVTSLDATGVGARDVFRVATEGGARLLGHEKLGKLIEGYAADIIGLNLNGNPSLTPFNDPISLVVFCASGRDVSFVMVDGAVLLRDGAFVSLDVDDTIERVESTARRYRSK